MDGEEEIIETLFDKATDEDDGEPWQEKICADVLWCSEVLWSADESDDLGCECDAGCDDESTDPCHECDESTDGLTFGCVGGVGDFVDHAVSYAGGDDDEDDDDAEGEFSDTLFRIVSYRRIDESDDDGDGECVHTTQKIC